MSSLNRLGGFFQYKIGVCFKKQFSSFPHICVYIAVNHFPLPSLHLIETYPMTTAFSRLQALHKRLNLFHVMLDDMYGVKLLETQPTLSPRPWSAFLMVNVGGNRSGVLWNSTRASTVAQALHESKDVVFQVS